MTRSRLAALLLAGLLPSVAGCSLLGGSSAEATGDKGYVSGKGQITELRAVDRGSPIDLDGEDLDGEPLSLSDLRGGVVVVNVWGAWCADCRIEQPDLNAAFEQTADVAEFVGIDIRDSSADTAKAYVRNQEVDYPSFYSPYGQALLAFEGVLSPRSIPSTVVLDAEGRVAAAVIGRLPTVQTLVDLVEGVAGE